MSFSTRIAGLALATLFSLGGAGLADPAGSAPARDSGPVVAGAQRSLTGYPGHSSRKMSKRDTTWSKYRITKDTYFAQPNEWTCSSSCYVMAIRALTGRDISLALAVERTGAQEGVGADNARVVEAFQKLGPDYEVITGRTSESSENMAPDSPQRVKERAEEYANLKRLLDEGYLVMINFREPVEQVGHYGILQGINDTAIEVADPYYGLSSVLPLDRFDYRSGFSSPTLHGWYLAVRPKHSRSKSR